MTLYDKGIIIPLHSNDFFPVYKYIYIKRIVRFDQKKGVYSLFIYEE